MFANRVSTVCQVSVCIPCTNRVQSDRWYSTKLSKIRIQEQIVLVRPTSTARVRLLRPSYRYVNCEGVERNRKSGALGSKLNTENITEVSLEHGIRVMFALFLTIKS